jgi:HlyD family secretion protein
MCAALGLGACKWLGQNASNQGTIVLSGTVEAREVDLGFQVGGRIAALRVDEGSTVRAGETVAVLDTHDFTLALARSRSDAAATKATLAALQAGSRPQQIRAGEAALAKAQAEARNAASHYERMRRLFASHNVSHDEYDQARTQVEVAQATVADAREQLALLKEGPRQEDIERAAAEYAAQTAAADIAQRELDYATLTSPVDGVVSVRLAEAGQVVGVGQPVFRIVELSHPWVRAYLAEPDLARVRLGQEAQVQVDGLPGKVFQGRLSFISPKAEFTPKTVETRALRVDLVYRVKIDVDNRAGELKLGMPADVTLKVAPTP